MLGARRGAEEEARLSEEGEHREGVRRRRVGPALDVRRDVGGNGEAGWEEREKGRRRARGRVGVGRCEDERGRAPEEEVANAAGRSCVGVRVARGQRRGAGRPTEEKEETEE